MAMHPDSVSYMKQFGISKPEDVFEGKFDWRRFLQAFLFRNSVMVNALHPIVGLRLAAAFVDLMINGYASPHGPKSITYIRDGVRLKGAWNKLIPGSQWWYWIRDLASVGKKPSKPPKNQPRGTGGVANPEYERGRDSEGIMRRSSNHVAQLMPAPWAVEVGYAIDLGTTRGRNDAAWAPIHAILKKWGLQWPLKKGVSRIVERWHHQAQDLAMRWYPGPFPKRPGVHRPIIDGFIGGDVGILQAQFAKILGLKLIPRSTKGSTPTGAIRHDGHYGPAGIRFCNQAQAKLGRPQTGVWVEADQVAFEKPAAKPPSQPAATRPSPPTNQQPEVAGLSDAQIDVMLRQISASVNSQRTALRKTTELQSAVSALKT